MPKDLKKLVFGLCEPYGTSGDETDTVQTAAKKLSLYASTRIDSMGNVIAELGPNKASNNILLEAHIDQIGLIVTGIDKNGFLNVDRCGGIDPRVLPGSPVIVHGRKPLTGVVCCTPPHLSDGKEDIPSTDKSSVDIGLAKDKAEKFVSPGDRITFYNEPTSLAGNRISSAGLDNRAGVASIIRCVQMLSSTELKCKITVLLSTREETGGQGASTGAFCVSPSKAICVDVGFACQPNVPPEKSHPLGGGPMIGFAPILDRCMSRALVKTAVKNKIPYKSDVMGDSTGTNSENIAVTQCGIPTGLISIPLRYMHTPAEVVDLLDIENTALLIAKYIKEGF